MKGKLLIIYGCHKLVLHVFSIENSLSACLSTLVYAAVYRSYLQYTREKAKDCRRKVETYICQNSAASFCYRNEWNVKRETGREKKVTLPLRKYASILSSHTLPPQGQKMKGSLCVKQFSFSLSLPPHFLQECIYIISSTSLIHIYSTILYVKCSHHWL